MSNCSFPSINKIVDDPKHYLNCMYNDLALVTRKVLNVFLWGCRLQFKSANLKFDFTQNYRKVNSIDKYAMAEIEQVCKNKQTKKRIRNPSEWKREKRKRLRVAGKSYINSKGDLVMERKMGEDCKCRRKCYTLVPEEVRTKLFDGYYSLNSHDEQNAYLFGLIRKHDIARKRSKESDRRTCSYRYFVRHRGKEVQVCRLAFAHIHGISPHKIRILCQKQEQNIMYPRDGRGKHDNRPRKISEDVLVQVKEHIYSIIRSDRVRDFLKEEKHSGPDVNITRMWKDYLSKYDPNYYNTLINSEKAQLSRQNGDILAGESLQLPNFVTSPSQNVHQQHQQNDQQQQHISAYPTSVDLSQYNLDLLGDSHYEDEDLSTCTEKQDSNTVPIVKHWLYSKVFHEELKLHDFLSLKKKLCFLKDPDKSSAGQQANKTERKQKSPKKISREKEMTANALEGHISSHLEGNTVMHHQEQVMSQPTIPSDMYILPVNLQDLSQLNHANDILMQQQHHTMHLNLHTFSTSPGGLINPVIQPQTQCTGSVGSLSLGQNTCMGYVAPTSFYQ